MSTFIVRMAGLAALLSSLNCLAGEPVINVALQSPTAMSLLSTQTGTANYLVTLNSHVPGTLQLSVNGLPSGVSQLTGGTSTCSGSSTVCNTSFSLNPGGNCCLKLQITGSGLTGNVALAPVVGTTPAAYSGSGYPILNVTLVGVLKSSVSTLALSINNPGAAGYSTNFLSGTPRKITLTNTSGLSIPNVTYSASPALPAGTTILPSTCGNIGPYGSCVLTITPGSNASSDCNDLSAAPTPSVITVNSANTPLTQIKVVVLGYSCLYQGGYLYSVDDTTNVNGSIGGRVADPLITIATSTGLGPKWSTDAINNAPCGSATGTNSGASIWGADQLSTSTNPSPNASTTPAQAMATLFAGQTNCNGLADGFCNSNNINIYYTTQAPSFSSVAAVCRGVTDGGFSDWYLPAICELGSANDNGTLCTGVVSQNVVQSLHDLIAASPCTAPSFCGTYWSSTEGNDPPNSCPNSAALRESFSLSPSQSAVAKNNANPGVRCSRLLTQ